MRYVLILSTALLCSGCEAFDLEANVQSDTSWSGSFDGRTVDGVGNQTIELGGDASIRCVAVQKKTRQGYLTVDVSGEDKKTTTADFGVVSACGGGH